MSAGAHVVALGAAIGLSIWNWEPGDTTRSWRARSRRHALARHRRCSSTSRASRRAAVAALDRHARGRARRVLLAAARLDRRHGRARRAENLITLFIGHRTAVDPALRAVRDRAAAAHVARGGSQVPRDRLGRLGHAALRPRADLRRHRRTSFDGIARAIGDRSTPPTRCCSPASRSPPPGSPSRPRSRPSTSGRPTSTRAPPRPITTFMAVATKAAAFAVFLRLFDEALPDVAARLGPGARRARGGDDRDRQRRRDPAALAQADARLVGRGAGRLHARGRGRGHPARAPGDRLLPRRLPVDERGGVRRGGRARARVRARRRPLRSFEGLGRRAPGSRGR